MSKKYFDADRYDAGDDNILAYSAAEHADEINGSNVEQRRLYRARPMHGVEFFWCTALHEVGLKGEGCGRQCDSYEPRNGKNGRCRHSAPCYEADRTEVLVLQNPDVRADLPPCHRHELMG